MPDNGRPGVSADQLRKIHRGQLITLAVIGLVLGVVGFAFPEATEFTVAVLFGSFLVASGAFRIVSASVAHAVPNALRWLSAVMGVLILITGILCLSDPFDSLVVLAFIIGIGWVLEGVVDFMLGLRGAISPRWFGFVSGIVSMAAGAAMFVLPAAGVELLVVIGSALLIAVSVSTLLTLPRKDVRSTPSARL